MEQLSFSQEPNEKLFFLGALAGLGKMGAAAGRAAAGRAAAGKAAASAAKKAVIPKPKIPVKISTGDINIGNKQQQEN
jgi:hypothetical protein